VPYKRQPPRLSRHEIRELGKVAASLMTVHESLQHTNWAGAAPSATIVGQAIDAIVPVYRRCRVVLPEVIAQLAAEAGEVAQQNEAGAGAIEEGDHGTLAGEEN
jgi:hypothetical protein